MILTSTDNQKDLPRYFKAVFNIAQSLETGRLDIKLADGRVFRTTGNQPGPAALIEIHNNDCFARLIREGDLGFSDAYLEGWWSTPDLQIFMDLVLDRNEGIFDGFPGAGLVRTFEKIRHWLNGNSKRQARKNISFHYDLGNDFYKKWLDETMSYSSALFKDGQEPTEKAQIRKYESMVNMMDVKPGDHVLEIGCGWGGFAEYAAKERGLNVTGLTISQEQHDYAVERMKKLGLSDKVNIVMRDYRDETGVYDGIASIEMFEAVGEQYWPTYFKTIRDRLKPGAKAALQIILISENRFQAYRKGVDFIQKYIFPGGMLPSPNALNQQIEMAGLIRESSVEFAKSYSQTLRRWHSTFNNKWDDIHQMGFDDRFRNMWNFYLTSCASAFEYGNCDVTQVAISKPK
ncbi:MAG: SAM-dependent methyltransferase [Rhodobacteraceae bacterium]|nr:SAM-dependent methyltransferase [Paracoccaceae bacterium]MBL6855438.1 class I SAM-dependent methyltransferase [Paracoccaceae bacterium]|tara:strand:+ start:226 stop:1434 length:1209 start_codon:yes stop_codon:yes gene_type:complete